MMNHLTEIRSRRRLVRDTDGFAFAVSPLLDGFLWSRIEKFSI